jgi:ribosomal protein S16
MEKITARTFRNFGEIKIKLLKAGSFNNSSYTILIEDSYGNTDVCYSYEELINTLTSYDNIKQIKERVG